MGERGGGVGRVEGGTDINITTKCTNFHYVKFLLKTKVI